MGRFRREWLEPVLFRAGEQPIGEAGLLWDGRSLEEIFARFQPFDGELLTGPNAVLLAQLGRQDDLAFGGDGGFHIGKISYLGKIKRMLYFMLDRGRLEFATQISEGFRQWLHAAVRLLEFGNTNLR